MWDLMNMEEDDFYKRKNKVQKTEEKQDVLKEATKVSVSKKEEEDTLENMLKDDGDKD